MAERYHDQVRLLLDVLPLVAEENIFALKGGTAINLFERNLPRLSVDIDLTYLPFDDRETALREISAGLTRIQERITQTVPGTRGTLVSQAGDLEAKLHCQRGRVQIKIEVNPTLRGHLLPVRSLACASHVQEAFEVFVKTPVVAHGELFGGKICAALDRQHPRDLFDVKLLLDAEGITEEVKLGFIASLISHGRPMHELIRPTIRDQQAVFAAQFEGMALVPFTYADHEVTLRSLVEELAAALDARDKDFLLRFKEGNPDWSLFPLANIEKLPGVQWKPANLHRLRDTDARHTASVAALVEALSG